MLSTFFFKQHGLIRQGARSFAKITTRLAEYDDSLIDNIHNPTPSLTPAQLQEKIEKIPIENYRNFVIAAHVDHGKSTLSDRLMELTGVVEPGGAKKQILDKLDVERERGITVKAQTVSMIYHYLGEDYLLHLVDSPGHVDFREEVSRSYASADGAVLLVDACEGVKAQTMANATLAKTMDLTLVPVLNKIDLDGADIPKVQDQVASLFSVSKDDMVNVSAKTGLYCKHILPKIVEMVPHPSGCLNKPLRALLVDSWYDPYKGVILLMNIVDGELKKGQKIVSCKNGKSYEVKEVGIMYPDRIPMKKLSAGQVAYVVPGMKNSSEAFAGDTFYALGKRVEPLPGFEPPQPMVFVGAFPAQGEDFTTLDQSIQHLVLNDWSVSLKRETSNALGQGWRLGFLGSLHASVFRQRLEKEYGAKLIITAPTVPYKVVYKSGEEKIISNPDDFPDLKEKMKIDYLAEPYVTVNMVMPEEYMDVAKTLSTKNRGELLEISPSMNSQVNMKYDLPLSHLVDDFFGKLKSATRGYANMDYQDAGYKRSDIVKLELLLNGKGVDALATVMHKSQVEKNAREFVSRLKEYLRIQQFEVQIQAKAQGRIVARETIKARKKDVLAKLHASDITRRKKLLEKQKQGKKMLKATGSVSISSDAYQAFLRRN
ncbi:unnamed protein product [Kuraishia capsulata CBS 1993]|uniref:Tr-type G domain-containing protein n=1 Tax=Kuraishia capsulata CBS 1993 TaxID=1382522 RepID=W6MJY0_9ASCO|nr:uncharacterized protein KUCA_T00002574001 [Kuraishia capsulata CBS 1993]CDK26601.1 unnamed protein product [Kuraishia capsulata CBS 1993]